MSWVLGASTTAGATKFLVVSDSGHIEEVNAASLSNQRISKSAHSSRLVITGEICTWQRSPAKDYLRALGIDVPAHLQHGHTVYCQRQPNGTRIHVPALAWMQGFFKPHKLLLPSIFTPCNIDLLGFVDYQRQPPIVVVDSNPAKYLHRRGVQGSDEPLRWMHTSHTAKKCAQSIYRNALRGSLALDLPQGVFKLVLHGLQKGKDFYVTKVTPITAKIAAHDCITLSDETFVFHRMADLHRAASSVHDLPPIPLGAKQQVALTDREWNVIAPLLGKIRQQQHCRRFLLDLILEKLSSKKPWKSTADAHNISKVTLTESFRRWHLDGRLESVLAVLSQMRAARSL